MIGEKAKKKNYSLSMTDSLVEEITRLRAEGALETVIPLLERLVALPSVTVNHVLNLSVAYEQVLEYRRAAEVLERELVVRELHARLCRAKQLFMDGQVEAVLAVPWDAVDVDPDDDSLRTERVMARLVRRLCSASLRPPLPVAPCRGEVYVVGDSHIVSLAWRVVEWPSLGGAVTLRPAHISGLKAFHVGALADAKKPGPLLALDQALRVISRRSPSATVLLVCGEIDCRFEEGIGLALRKGLHKSVAEAASETTRRLVEGALQLEGRHSLRIVLTTALYPLAALFPALKTFSLESERFTYVSAFNAHLRAKTSGSGLHLVDWAEAGKTAVRHAVMRGKEIEDGTCLDRVHLGPIQAQLLQNCLTGKRERKE